MGVTVIILYDFGEVTCFYMIDIFFFLFFSLSSRVGGCRIIIILENKTHFAYYLFQDTSDPSAEW